MPTTPKGREYRLTKNYFIYTPEPWDEDDDPAPDIKLPLRMTAKETRRLKNINEATVDDFDLVEQLFPSEADALGELDVFELADVVEAWMAEFTNRNDVSLGEPEHSTSSSASIEE